MKSTYLCSIFLVLLVAVYTDALFFNRRRPRPKPKVDVTKWTVDMDGENTLSQKAVAWQGKDAVMVFTYGKDMNEMNVTKGMVIMEFSDPAGVMAFRVGSWWRGMCFLLATTDTLEQVKQDLVDRNGTTITLPDTVAFNGTADHLSYQETEVIFEQHPVLKPFCRRSKVVETTMMNVGDEDPDTKTLTFLGLDSKINLMVRGGSGGPGGPGGPGGQKGPKRPGRPKGPLWPKIPRRG